MKNPPHLGEQLLTREALACGALVQALRRNPPPGVRLRSDEELQESLEQTLREHPPGDDLHIFGYGSLMWNPALHVIDSQLALVQGWHRRFCIRTLMARGSVERPGAMLALDRGGACVGMLMRIAAPRVRDELKLLWRREMLTGSYDVRWVNATARGDQLRALTFVARPDHERYIGALPVQDVAGLIRTGEGILGSTRSYFELTLQTLARLRVRDRGIERLRRAVLAADRA
jgi:cation transport protein ChaC